jgi:hypothetical protein
MCGVFRDAATTGLHPFMRSNLLHLYCLSHLQAYTHSNNPHSNRNQSPPTFSTLHQIMSSTPMCAMLRCGSTPASLPSVTQRADTTSASTSCLSIGCLALLPSVHASPKLVRSAAFTTVSSSYAECAAVCIHRSTKGGLPERTGEDNATQNEYC